MVRLTTKIGRIFLLTEVNKKAVGISWVNGGNIVG